jgi:hypothetical protein
VGSGTRLHRSGIISTFVAGQAAVIAVGCWVWPCVLVFRHLPVAGWHVLASTGAVAFALTAVVLAVRSANHRAAADRHDIARRAAVECPGRRSPPRSARPRMSRPIPGRSSMAPT